jgi:hypothetical protein
MRPGRGKSRPALRGQALGPGVRVLRCCEEIADAPELFSQQLSVVAEERRPPAVAQQPRGQRDAANLGWLGAHLLDHRARLGDRGTEGRDAQGRAMSEAEPRPPLGVRDQSLERASEPVPLFRGREPAVLVLDETQGARGAVAGRDELLGEIARPPAEVGDRQEECGLDDRGRDENDGRGGDVASDADGCEGERDERDEKLDGQRATSRENPDELVLGTEHCGRGGLVSVRGEMERAGDRA